MKLYHVKGVAGANTPPLILEDLPTLTDGNSRFSDPQAPASVSADVGAFLAANKPHICCIDHEIDLAGRWWDFGKTAWTPNADQADHLKWHLNACAVAQQVRPRGFGFWSYGVGYNPFASDPNLFQPAWAADRESVRAIYEHPAVTHLFPSFYCLYTAYPLDWVKEMTCALFTLAGFRKPMLPFLCPYIIDDKSSAYGQYVGDGMWRTALDAARDLCGGAVLWLNQIPFTSPQWVDILASYATF